MAATRPPPRILFVHNGTANTEHVKYLTAAGLGVAEVHAASALAEALDRQPDIVVLDFAVDGEVTAQLKGHPDTSAIPIIALMVFFGG